MAELERKYWFKKFDIDNFNKPYPLTEELNLNSAEPLVLISRGGLCRVVLTKFYSRAATVFFFLYSKFSKASTASWIKQWGGN